MTQYSTDLPNIYQKYLSCKAVCTDTRSIIEGCMFFALKGPNFNANKFAKEALEKGASYAVVDQEAYAVDERFVLVNDVLKTLQQLANHHRKQFDIPFIGITGSNGKTTTKELMYAVLSKKYKVSATKGNLNNHIGVPLTLLSIDSSVEIAIIEMGANHVGDIAELCAIAEPTHGLITNIGKAHIGEFGGYENIIRGKSELYQHLIQSDGFVWINSNEDILMNMSKRFKSPSFYPNEGDDFVCEMKSSTPFITYSTAKNDLVQTQIVGGYNFQNIATALAVGATLEVEEDDANKAIASYQSDNNRSQIVKKGSNTILLDAYNANPSSMEAAINTIDQMQAEHKVLVLGDMYELGEETEKEHRKIGQLVKGKNFTQVYFCGKMIKSALRDFPEGLYFEDKSKLAESIKAQNFTDALILLKASRGIGLETVLDHL